MNRFYLSTKAWINRWFCCGRLTIAVRSRSESRCIAPYLSPAIKDAVSFSLLASPSIGWWSQSLEKASATTLSSPSICLYSKSNSCNASFQRRTLVPTTTLTSLSLVIVIEIKLSYSIKSCIGLFLKGGPVELCLMQCLTNKSDRKFFLLIYLEDVPTDAII